jgi:hypothetical protein
MKTGPEITVEKAAKNVQMEGALHPTPVTPDGNIYCIENAIPLSDIESINKIIDQDHKDSEGFKRYMDGEVEHFVEILRKNQKFRDTELHCRNQVQAFLDQNDLKIPSKPFYVIRCVNSGSRSQAFTRHFDSHNLTMLIPLKLAVGDGHNGDFIIYNKPRQLPSSFVNLIQKLLHTVTHYLPVEIREKLTIRDIQRGVSRKIPVKVGNVYFFNGFINLHGNFDVETGERRSLLMHDFDPGKTFGLSEFARILRRLHLIK